MFYGDSGREPSWHPERFGRYGMATGSTIDEEVRLRLPPTMVRDDHLDPSSVTMGVIFRELSCPDFDRPGSFATVRPVVCQNGRVWADFFLSDHQTPCTEGDPGCQRRIYSWPILATGGSGFDAPRMGATVAGGDSLLEVFGSDYRHLCTFGAGGSITDIADGRVSLEGNSFHFEASSDPGTPGQWVPGAGQGDGLENGYDPDEGYYPRAGWYEDQNGEDIWFEPFSGYDNYGAVQTAGDFSRGTEELIMRGDRDAPGDLFVEHPDESRMVYDEFVSTPYEVKARGADFGLWNGVRTGDVNTDEPHLIWGWPTLDLQDAQTSYSRRLQTMIERRLETRQQLYGVAPGSAQAEQVWIRNDGPMSFFGATRVGNGTGGSEKGGCLLEVNPPGFNLAYGEVMPFRPVLDNRLQAWCVMERDVHPENSCISIDAAPQRREPDPVFTRDPRVNDAECDCWVCSDGADGIHVGTYPVDMACPVSHEPGATVSRVCPSAYPPVSPCADGR
ncbi:MAG: hypothetical protein OXC00_13645 [Acidimicrobiaceae bacterium]|nr:hypothetical protein [Acidimicrobiaceae bacterium]